VRNPGYGRTSAQVLVIPEYRFWIIQTSRATFRSLPGYRSILQSSEAKWLSSFELKQCELIHNTDVVIKGEPNEDAVLCTSDKTYLIRSAVVLSNSILVVTPSPVAASGTNNDQQNGSSGVDIDMAIRDTLHDVLELQPSAPKLTKLNGLMN